MNHLRIKLRFSTPATVWFFLRFLVGLGLGFFLHYLFYRVSLPVEPFIYVVF